MMLPKASKQSHKEEKAKRKKEEIFHTNVSHGQCELPSTWHFLLLRLAVH
jgi:hypothetical protein